MLSTKALLETLPNEFLTILHASFSDETLVNIFCFCMQGLCILIFPTYGSNCTYDMAFADVTDDFVSTSDLQLTSGLQVGEQLDNVFGHGWSDWQMGSLGLESVLIGDPVDGDGDSIMDVRVASLGHGTSIFLSNLFLDSVLLDLGSILALEAVIINIVISRLEVLMRAPGSRQV